MFNQEQYDILKRCSEKQNIAEWNNYRAEHPKVRIELQNADLRRARLEGAILNEANLEGARLEDADLFAADLRKADLRRANLEKANLWGVTLREANLEDARLVSANLENADLRGAHLERVKLWGANLEDAIIPEVAKESLSGPQEQVEVNINVVDDIAFKELIRLLKCLERLSMIIGGAPPHLNDIQISHAIDAQSVWAETEMDNRISLNLPKHLAEHLHGILHVGRARPETTPAAIQVDEKASGAGKGLREILKNADFSEEEQQAVLAKLMLPKMEEDQLMEDLGVVAHLVECSRIFFQA